MKNRVIVLFLVIIASVILPLSTVGADTPISSGSGISTGYKDWAKAVDNIGTSIEASYLQLEASWYNEAYDIYRIYLNFVVPQNITRATLTIYPTGVIYNQDNIKLVVVDDGRRIGEIALSSLNIRTTATIELDGITTGSLILMSSSEWYNLPPSKWNWITLDNNAEKPYLTYSDSVISEDVPSIPNGLSASAIAGYVILGITIVVVIGLLVWRFARSTTVS